MVAKVIGIIVTIFGLLLTGFCLFLTWWSFIKVAMPVDRDIIPGIGFLLLMVGVALFLVIKGIRVIESAPKEEIEVKPKKEIEAEPKKTG